MSQDWKNFTGELPEGPEYPTHENLTALLQGFCDLTGAPKLSADELAVQDGLNNHVSAWLSGFCDMWDDLD